MGVDSILASEGRLTPEKKPCAGSMRNSQPETQPENAGRADSAQAIIDQFSHANSRRARVICSRYISTKCSISSVDSSPRSYVKVSHVRPPRVAPLMARE